MTFETSLRALARLGDADLERDWTWPGKGPADLRNAFFFLLMEEQQALVASTLEAAWAELTLDVDATIIEAEKQEAEWTYAKVKGYQPLLGYVEGVCVHHEFRAGDRFPTVFRL